MGDAAGSSPGVKLDEKVRTVAESRLTFAIDRLLNGRFPACERFAESV